MNIIINGTNTIVTVSIFQNNCRIVDEDDEEKHPTIFVDRRFYL